MDFTNVAKALTARGFKVSSFETAKEAAEYLNTQIDGATVGFGGSITLEELGLYALLSGHNTVFSHWHLPEGGDAASLRAQAAGSEHYLLSANGIAETGEIINIDGTGNRVSSSLYGHKKVWFVVGSNKLAPTYDEALWRARNIAAPKNAQRLGVKYFPAMMLVDPKQGSVRPLSYGFISQDDLAKQFLNVSEDFKPNF